MFTELFVMPTRWIFHVPWLNASFHRHDDRLNNRRRLVRDPASYTAHGSLYLCCSAFRRAIIIGNCSGIACIIIWLLAHCTIRYNFVCVMCYFLLIKARNPTIVFMYSSLPRSLFPFIACGGFLRFACEVILHGTVRLRLNGPSRFNTLTCNKDRQ